MKKALLFPIILVVFGLVLFLTHRLYYSSDYYAYGLACDAVRTNMKGPGAAVFPSASTAQYARGSDAVYITSYVDGQNAFGGPVRTEWIANLPRIANRYGPAVITFVPPPE